MSPSGELIISSLPVWISVMPFLASIALVYLGRTNVKQTYFASIFVTGVNLLLVLRLYQLVSQGVVEYTLSQIMGFGLYWRVDMTGAIFALLAAFLWFMATIYAGVYMAHEHNQNRFYTGLMLSLGGCMGVFLAGNMFTLYPFFEAMALTSWLLVIHEQDEPAMEAGGVYLYMGIIGGLSLLLGILLVQFSAGHTLFIPIMSQLQDASISPYLLAGLFAMGFGVKAGMVPMHIWLPKAHPVAPSPASALLSAVMIKAGAYGILRVLTTTLSGAQVSLLIGRGLIVIAAVTMIVGALMGIRSRSLKQVLAYSSISQMGYILFGFGIMAALGQGGGLAFAGGIMHLINHGIYKAALFLLAGSIFLQTRELSLGKLGGLAKPMFWTMLVFLITASAIMGVPGLNGYTSKTLLHHAVVEAYQHDGGQFFYYMEKVFNLASALTVVYISKLVISLFFTKAEKDVSRIKEAAPVHLAVFGVLTSIMLFIGLFPQYLLKHLVFPAGIALGFTPYDLNHALHANFWDGHDLMGAAQALGLGALLYLLFITMGFVKYLPGKLSIEGLLYRPVINLVAIPFQKAIVLSKISDTKDENIEEFSLQTLTKYNMERCFYQPVACIILRCRGGFVRGVTGRISILGQLCALFAQWSLRFLQKKDGQGFFSFISTQLQKMLTLMGVDHKKAAQQMAHFIAHQDHQLHQSAKGLNEMYEKLSDADFHLSSIWKSSGQSNGVSYLNDDEKHRRFWDTKNVGFDALIIAAVIAVVLYVFIHMGTV